MEKPTVTEFKIQRTRCGFTQEGLAQVATASGTPIRQEYVSLLDRGLLPRPAEARTLAEILGVSQEKLFGKERS
jgi:predicted transcriptional regulator